MCCIFKVSIVRTYILAHTIVVLYILIKAVQRILNVGIRYKSTAYSYKM